MSLLASRLMIGGSDQRDLAKLATLDVGRLAETGDEWEPYRLLDADGAVVEPVAVFLAGLQAEDKSVSTLKAYGNDLLLWWRWLAAVGVAWNQATTIEGRDFLRWMRSRTSRPEFIGAIGMGLCRRPRLRIPER